MFPRPRADRTGARLTALLGLFALAAPAVAEEEAARAPDDRPWLVAGQLTGVGWALPRFHSPYANPAISFGPGPDQGWSTLATIYLGTRLWPGGSAVVDGEWADGTGLPNVSGVSGYPDSNMIRVAKTGIAPYVARAFVQHEIALGEAGAGAEEPPETPEDPFGPDAPGASDDPRHTFMNWALMTNGAWDYAADTRGYTWGTAAVIATPRWAVRAAFTLMPTDPNGPNLSWDVGSSRSEMLEGQVLWSVAGKPGSARLLGYLNHSRAARYADALAGAPPGTPPDLAPYRRAGATKRGVALAVEQEAGPARIFVRGSWNDGVTETFAFTEIDRAASIGGDVGFPGLAGGRDRVGAAVAVGGLSPDHARYLAAGGTAFQLGDGALRQGTETIVEAYYLVRAWTGVEVTADVQTIWNPGMNADRGPAAVFGLRLHVHR